MDTKFSAKVLNKIININNKYINNTYHYIPNIIRIKFTKLRYTVDHYVNHHYGDALNIYSEIKGIIFTLISDIANDSHTDLDFVITFGDLALEFIEEEINKNNDIFELINMLEKMSLSFNLNLQFNKLGI